MSGKELDRAIIRFLQATSNVTMPVLSLKLDVPDDPIHGRQHYISRSIVRLRRKGLIKDVPNRCEYCGRAPRSHKAVVLHLTQAGREFL